MSHIYVNLNEYNFLVNIIEAAMLTRGEIDSDGYDAAESLLKKLGYPEAYRNEISEKIAAGKFRYLYPRHLQMDVARAKKFDERCKK